MISLSGVRKLICELLRELLRPDRYSAYCLIVLIENLDHILLFDKMSMSLNVYYVYDFFLLFPIKYGQWICI